MPLKCSHEIHESINVIISYPCFLGDHYSMVTLLNDNVDVNIRGMIKHVTVLFLYEQKIMKS